MLYLLISMIKNQQKGFSHIGLLLFGGLIIAVIGFAGARILTLSSPDLSNATASARRHKPTGRLKGNNLKAVKSATANFWMNNERGSIRWASTTCKPSRVKLANYHSTKTADKEDDGAIAYVVSLNGAYRSNPYEENHAPPHGEYCKIHWNLDETKNSSLKDNCETFIHEYGHMMGFAHNADPRNIMYAGYAPHDKHGDLAISDDLSYRLFQSAREYADKSTGCGSIKDANKIF